MKKQLFFDDNKLFGRNNVIRKYGMPKLINTYSDQISSTDYCTGQVFLLENGKYRLLYMAHGKTFNGKKLFSAISDDGIHFLPEYLNDMDECKERLFSHEVMTLNNDEEIAFIYEDKYCNIQKEKYKLLMATCDFDNLRVIDSIYASPDLLNWTLKENVSWGNGAEPLASVFYNRDRESYTIIERPFWGVRCVGYKETKDWKSFSEFRLCLNVDSNDESLAEVYGMYAFEYDGMYIGLPHLYRNLKSELGAKFRNGIIDTQLAYSYDGMYWKRSIREPFISGLDIENPINHENYKMIWVFNMQKMNDDTILFYAAATEREHGVAFGNPGTGKILVFRMRTDGFVYLASEDKDKTSSVITREKIWHGGEMCINLSVQEATLAVYITDDSEYVSGNVLGIAKSIEGYSHEDCIPFSGDDITWIPQYKSGRKIDDLKGKTLVFELRFVNGEVYSFAGEYTDVYNTEAARYRKLGIMPENDRY